VFASDDDRPYLLCVHLHLPGEVSQGSMELPATSRKV
jgi:hypothetical protein